MGKNQKQLVALSDVVKWAIKENGHEESVINSSVKGLWTDLGNEVTGSLQFTQTELFEIITENEVPTAYDIIFDYCQEHDVANNFTLTR